MSLYRWIARLRSPSSDIAKFLDSLPNSVSRSISSEVKKANFGQDVINSSEQELILGGQYHLAGVLLGSRRSTWDNRTKFMVLQSMVNHQDTLRGLSTIEGFLSNKPELSSQENAILVSHLLKQVEDNSEIGTVGKHSAIGSLNKLKLDSRSLDRLAKVAGHDQTLLANCGSDLLARIEVIQRRDNRQMSTPDYQDAPHYEQFQVGQTPDDEELPTYTPPPQIAGRRSVERQRNSHTGDRTHELGL